MLLSTCLHNEEEASVIGNGVLKTSRYHHFASRQLSNKAMPSAVTNAYIVR